MKMFSKIGVFMMVMITSVAVMAQEAVEAVVAVVAPVADLPVMDFMSQVFAAVQGFGGLSWGLKVASVLFLVIASMKVSVLRSYTWDKVPQALKVWLAPFLALLAGLFSLGSFDKVALAAWVFAGAGAILLQNLLEGIKQIPGIGQGVLSAISFIELLLRKPKA